MHRTQAATGVGAIRGNQRARAAVCSGLIVAKDVPGRRVDLFEPLCEGCGYPLAEIEGSAACPECGRAVADSAASRRVGTALQRGEIRGWARVWLDVHTRPERVWNVLKPRSGWEPAIALGYCWIAGQTAALGVVLLLAHRTQLIADEVLLWVMLALAGGWALTLVYLLLTEIEARGVSFFSRRRGWRMPRDLSRAIGAHAAATWWVSAVGLSLGLWVTGPLSAWLTRVAPASWQMVLPPLEVVPSLAGFTVGMLVFETVVYTGVRACRFANRAPGSGASA